MSTFLLLLLTCAAAIAIYISDTQHRVQPKLRWAFTGRNYIIQRQTVFGAWVPVGRASYPNLVDVEAAIERIIETIEEDLRGKFGPTKTPRVQKASETTVIPTEKDAPSDHAPEA